MFRPCILAIVRLYCKINKQLYNMCVEYCGGNEMSSDCSEWHGLELIWTGVNTLKTKRRLLYLKPQSVPRCKHFSSRL